MELWGVGLQDQGTSMISKVKGKTEISHSLAMHFGGFF